MSIRDKITSFLGKKKTPVVEEPKKEVESSKTSYEKFRETMDKMEALAKKREEDEKRMRDFRRENPISYKSKNVIKKKKGSSSYSSSSTSSMHDINNEPDNWS